MELGEIIQVRKKLKNYPHKDFLTNEEWSKFYDNYCKDMNNHITFIEYLIKYRKESFEDFINEAFTWANTPEHVNYWRKISGRTYKIVTRTK